MLKKMSDKEYFNLPAASNSFLVRLSKSLAHAKTPMTPTPAMKIGTMIHRYFLEPEVFAETYILELPIDKRTKKYKNFKEDHKGKILYSGKDQEMLDGIEKVMSEYTLTAPGEENPFEIEKKPELPCVNVRDLIRNSVTEVAGFWRQDGIDCKMKIDAIYAIYDKALLIDLKKTYDIEQFKWSVKKYKYYRQAALYLSGYKAITGIDATFIFLAIESSAPYGVKGFTLSDAMLKQGQEENEAALWLYKNMNKYQENKVYNNGVEALC